MSPNSLSIISGGFDPVHKGHVRLIKEAASQHGFVICILNSDEWLVRKKGRAFMPWEDRKEILEHMHYVAQVVPVDDADGTVCAGLKAIFAQYPGIRLTFCNGGDRVGENVPEVSLCNELGIHLAFNVGGGKVESSSRLIAEARP